MVQLHLSYQQFYQQFYIEGVPYNWFDGICASVVRYVPRQHGSNLSYILDSKSRPYSRLNAKSERDTVHIECRAVALCLHVAVNPYSPYSFWHRFIPRSFIPMFNLHMI